MRSIAALLAVALMTTAAACGGSDDPEPTTVSVTVPAETPSAETATTQPDTTITDGEAVNESDADTPQPGSGAAADSAITAAEAVLTSAGTPDQACGSYVTANFIVTAYGGEQNCIGAREGQALASAITVRSGDESSTQLVVVPDGGPYGDSRVEVDLVEEEGGFRVDALEAHVPAGP